MNITDALKPYPLGWRAKLGFLVPSHDTGYGSYEFITMAPDGVVPLETRVPARHVTVDQMEAMVAGAVDAARLLADAKPDVIDFIATAPCFVAGVEKEAHLVSAIAGATGIQATSGGRSVTEALRFVGASRILTYTPYIGAIQDATERYFADQGFDVLGGVALNSPDPDAVNRVPPLQILADIVHLTRMHPEADGVFVVGGCFRTLDIVDRLEQLIGIPVVGTQQANMFNCLRMCHVDEPLNGFGQLLSAPSRSRSLTPA